MPVIKKCKNFEPRIHDSAYIADNATLIGDVVIGENSSIWFNAIVRGDVNKIEIGKNVNIQDGAVVHCTFNKTQTIIGDNVSIGHNAIIHGCKIKGNSLIGMGAIVMDNSIIEENVIIAAGSVVLENTITEKGCLYAGAPARKIKELNETQIQRLIVETPKNYITYSSWFEE